VPTEKILAVAAAQGRIEVFLDLGVCRDGQIPRRRLL